MVLLEWLKPMNNKSMISLHEELNKCIEAKYKHFERDSRSHRNQY